MTLDDQKVLAAYRQGLSQGNLQSATPNVVRQLIGWIDDLQDTLALLQTDLAPRLHRRQCWPCQTIHWHADDHDVYVDCPVCGSRDTPKIKEPQ